jgi:hypothetical protein
MPSDYLVRANNELILARVYNQQGFPGKARVCARRAAGAALLYYMEKNQDSPQTKNAYEILLYTQSSMIFPGTIQEFAHVLTLRVDGNFNLPSSQDPILAAEAIVTWVTSKISEGD